MRDENRRKVVNSSSGPDGAFRSKHVAGAVSYTAIALGTLGGTLSSGSAINSNEQITGNSGMAGNAAAHAFLHSGTGVTNHSMIDPSMIDLGTLGGTYSFGQSINASGQVAGYSYTSGSEIAFLYSAGSMIGLGTLGGGNSFGNGVNASGQVTGSSAIANGDGHAFLYSSGKMTDLGLADQTVRVSASTPAGRWWGTPMLEETAV